MAESILAQQLIFSSLLLYSAILLLLLLYGTFRYPLPQYQLLVLSIPAISRLMAYTLPLGNLSPMFAHLIIGIPMGLTAVSMTWVLGHKWPALHLAWQKMPTYLLLLLGGIISGLILHQLQPPAPLTWSTPVLLLFYLFVLIGAMAFLEEWLFRGIMQTALNRVWNNWVWVSLVVALFYTALTFSQAPFLFSLTIFLLAMLLSWLRYRSQSLFEVVLLHGTINVVYFLILPIWLT